MPRTLRAVVVALVAVALSATPASAHTSLIDVSPAEGATISPGDHVVLTFSDPLLSIGAEANFTDAAGSASRLEVTFPAPEQVAMVVPAEAAGGPGTLGWRVVAEDGHPITGTLAFDIDGAPVASPSPEATQTPDAATASPEASAVPGAADPDGDVIGPAVTPVPDADAADRDDQGWAWWVVAAVAGLALVAVAALRLRAARARGGR